MFNLLIHWFSCLLLCPSVHAAQDCNPRMPREFSECVWKFWTKGVFNLPSPMLYRCCFNLPARVWPVSPTYIKEYCSQTMQYTMFLMVDLNLSKNGAPAPPCGLNRYCIGFKKMLIYSSLPPMSMVLSWGSTENPNVIVHTSLQVHTALYLVSSGCCSNCSEVVPGKRVQDQKSLCSKAVNESQISLLFFWERRRKVN